MSIGSLGVIGSLASTSVALAKGTDVEKVQRESTDQARQTDGEKKAESAAGIGETSEDAQASERDADGRRMWERPEADAEPTAEEPAAAEAPPISKDPTGERGGVLDISG